MVSPTKPAEPYPGLEVVNDQAQHAPELDLRHQPDKEAVHIGEKQYESASTPPTERKIWGMKRKVAFIVFAVVGLVVVGAVVGGAVGATQSSSSNSGNGPARPTTPSPVQPTTPLPNGPFSSSTSTSISTVSSSSTASTASASATPIGEGQGTYTCPESDGTDFITGPGTGSLSFRQLCDADWYVGDTAVAGSGVDTVEDLTVVLEFSLVDCIEQCAVYSLTHSPPCLAVAYGANITAAQARGFGGNCFLKNARGIETHTDTSGQAQAAYMVED